MALIKCPECGKKVSTEAARCRNCGYPIPEINKEQIKTDTVIEDISIEKAPFKQADGIKTIRCKNCGVEIAAGARFCPECGRNLYSENTTSNNEQGAVETPIVVTPSIDASKRKSKTKSWIIAVAGALIVLIIAILFFPKNGIENEVKAILEDDLGSSVKITTLYYNEDKQGCLVEFETKNSVDIAAVHLDSGKVEYQSEYDYYSTRAEKLRKQSPINEQELHKCNQKILECSDLISWKFSVKLNGATDENGWKRIK